MALLLEGASVSRSGARLRFARAAVGDEPIPADGQRTARCRRTAGPDSSSSAGSLDRGLHNVAVVCPTSRLASTNQALKRACRRLMERHRPLANRRSEMRNSGRSAPCASTEARSPVEPSSGNSRPPAFIAAEAYRPFDLEREPPLRIMPSAEPGRRGDRLAPGGHHMAVDFWSLSFSPRDLSGRLLLGAGEWRRAPGSAPSRPLRCLPLWRLCALASGGGSRERRVRALGHWPAPAWQEPAPLSTCLRTAAAPAPGESGSARRSFRGAGARRAARRTACRLASHGAPSSLPLLAVFQALLQRHSGQDDLIIGLGRLPGASTLTWATWFGYFVTPLPLA